MINLNKSLKQEWVYGSKQCPEPEHEVESADSASLCHCVNGYFLDGHVCRRCSAGARCGGGRLATCPLPGSVKAKLSFQEVLPGYFSFESQPAWIYKCALPSAFNGSSHGLEVMLMPGDVPATAAVQRDETRRAWPVAPA